MLGLSPLRWAGLLLGALLIIGVLLRLRRYEAYRGPLALYALVGASLVAVSVLPQLVNLPADLFALRDHPAGRLITLLILATALALFLVLWNRAKLDRVSGQQETLIRSLARDAFFQRQPETEAASVWVILPAFNEAANVPALLERIAETKAPDVQVLVVDDGSSDDTGAVAEHHGAAVARLPVNAGGGTGLRTGFDIALASGAQYVVTMDADGQHDPAYLEPLLEPLRRGEAEVVIGSRTLGAEAPASAARALGVRLFNQLISWLLGIRITDCASGYRAMTAQALRQLHLAQPQYHTAELIIEAAKRGFRIVDVGVAIGPRWSGESKKGRDWSYGLMFLRTVIKTWLR